MRKTKIELHLENVALAASMAEMQKNFSILQLALETLQKKDATPAAAPTIAVSTDNAVTETAEELEKRRLDHNFYVSLDVRRLNKLHGLSGGRMYIARPDKSGWFQKLSPTEVEQMQIGAKA